MEGKRKNRDLIILGINLNNCVRNNLEAL
jgi:hypothetical protein